MFGTFQSLGTIDFVLLLLKRRINRDGMAQCSLNTFLTETIDLEAEDLYRQPIVSKVMTNIAEGTINFLAHFWRISTMLKGIAYAKSLVCK